MIAEVLINHGADFREGFNDESCLDWSARNGHLRIVESLLNHGADMNTKNKNGKTPLTLARENGKSEVVEYLIHYKKGCRI